MFRWESTCCIQLGENRYKLGLDSFKIIHVSRFFFENEVLHFDNNIVNSPSIMNATNLRFDNLLSLGEKDIRALGSRLEI